VAAAASLVVVADHAKWGVRGFCRITGLDEVDIFITDRAFPAAAQAEVSAHVKEILIAAHSVPVSSAP